MERFYKATRGVPYPRPKTAMQAYLQLSKHTFEYYLECVGMPWTRGYGPPPENHLILLVGMHNLVVQWINPTWCMVLGRERADIVGDHIRDVARGGAIDQAEQIAWGTIVHKLCVGDIAVGEMDSWTMTAASQRLPLHLRVTYGRPYECLFVDAEVSGPPESPLKAEVFNVEPGIILRHRGTDTTELTNMEDLLADWMKERELVTRQHTLKLLSDLGIRPAE
jgi:hypothetical protein